MGARRIVWVLFQFDHIWVFALPEPSSSEVPNVLLNQPINAMCNVRHKELCIQCASAQCLQLLSLGVLYGHASFVFIKVRIWPQFAHAHLPNQREKI